MNEDFNLLPYLQGGMGKIYAVNTVSLSWIESDSGSDAILIVAEGEVISEGWKNPRLISHTRMKEMPDGIWEFDFVADAPPPGIVRPALVSVRAEYLVTSVPPWLTGIRVHGSTKSAEIHLR